MTCGSKVISEASLLSHSDSVAPPSADGSPGLARVHLLGPGLGDAACRLCPPSPASFPTVMCWFELQPREGHCLLSHTGNSVMTGYDPPPPPYLILISPALHFAINDSSQQNSFQHAIDRLAGEST